MRQKIVQVYKQMSINKLLIQKKILPIYGSACFSVCKQAEGV